MLELSHFENSFGAKYEAVQFPCDYPFSTQNLNRHHMSTEKTKAVNIVLLLQISQKLITSAFMIANCVGSEHIRIVHCK